MGTDELADEMLMAYADGELDEAAARRVESAMAADADVASRVVSFQRTRRLARAAFATPEEVPEALRLAIESRIREATGTERRSAVVVPFPARSAPVGRAGWPASAMAAAAVVAAVLASGVIGFYAARGDDAAGPGLASLGPDVTRALSTAASGETAAVSGGDLRLVQSFTAGDGTLCREFELSGRAEIASGVACRGGEGWRVRFAAVAPAGDGGDYRPASGDDLLDGFLAAIGAGEMLDPAAERAALESSR